MSGQFLVEDEVNFAAKSEKHSIINTSFNLSVRGTNRKLKVLSPQEGCP